MHAFHSIQTPRLYFLCVTDYFFHMWKLRTDGTRHTPKIYYVRLTLKLVIQCTFTKIKPGAQHMTDTVTGKLESESLELMTGNFLCSLHKENQYNKTVKNDNYKQWIAITIVGFADQNILI